MTQPAYRSIYVPLDGSPFAELALPVAVDIASRSGAMLQIALVHHPVPALATALEVPEIEAQLDQEARAREQTYLRSIEARIRGIGNVPVTSVLLDGPAAAALRIHVERTGADLVVLTTHGRGPVSRFWLGSVADHLMRQLHTPVLLVRQGEVASAPRRFGRILVALDGSPFAERAMDAVIRLGQVFQVEYALVLVVEPPLIVADPSGLSVVPLPVESEQRLRRSAERYLDGMAARVRQEGARVTTHAVTGQGAAPTLLAQADLLHADLIALASHGAGGVERLVVGSVADKVIRGSSLPTLVVRPPLD
jgi:nucleotide-binding universal stress UspA family protein